MSPTCGAWAPSEIFVKEGKKGRPQGSPIRRRKVLYMEENAPIGRKKGHPHDEKHFFLGGGGRAPTLAPISAGAHVWVCAPRILIPLLVGLISYIQT